MTNEQLATFGKDPPILLADGSFGLIIRYWGSTVGVQIPGEDTICEISINDIVDIGNGALKEDFNEKH